MRKRTSRVAECERTLMAYLEARVQVYREWLFSQVRNCDVCGAAFLMAKPHQRRCSPNCTATAGNAAKMRWVNRKKGGARAEN